MGREAASYAIRCSRCSPGLTRRRSRSACTARPASSPCARARSASTSVLRDPYRYWIDLRVHRGAEPRFEIRIALTNDTWALRAPLERALTPMPPQLAGRPLLDAGGAEIAIAGADGWSLALEDDYGRRRDAFIARVGDFTAPISADHVYLYIHQTRWNQDNDDELAWHREREIARLQEAWVDELTEPPCGGGLNGARHDEFCGGGESHGHELHRRYERPGTGGRISHQGRVPGRSARPVAGRHAMTTPVVTELRRLSPHASRPIPARVAQPCGPSSSNIVQGYGYWPMGMWVAGRAPAQRSARLR